MAKTEAELIEMFDTGKEPTGPDFAELIKGVVGPEGPRGLQGIQGVPGKDGVGTPGTNGTDGKDGKDGVSVTGATSDGTNITFTLSEGEPIVVPWPAP